MDSRHFDVRKKAMMRNVLRDEESMEDLIDIAILEKRQNEPSRSLDRYLAESKIKNRKSKIL